MRNDKWKMENGKWKMENGKWRGLCLPCLFLPLTRVGRRDDARFEQLGNRSSFRILESQAQHRRSCRSYIDHSSKRHFRAHPRARAVHDQRRAHLSSRGQLTMRAAIVFGLMSLRPGQFFTE